LSEHRRNFAGDWRAHAALVGAAALVTGLAWMAVVPPFEGTDESHFYNLARQFAARPERRELLLFRLSAPIIRSLSPAADYVAPEYNPAFKFVNNNERGKVNRFVHDRPVAPREHVRTLVALRGVVVVLSVATVLMIFAIARMSLADASLAPLVACLCLWIPQFCFVNATFHPEAITRLFAAAVTLVIVARATGRLARVAAWLLLPLTIALAPLVDRQALFLAPFAALALVATERTWKARAVAAIAIVVPIAAAAQIVLEHTELGTDLSPWRHAVFHPFKPFTTADPTRGFLGPGAPYYAYEFVPKLFEGFWGWMGQPSILLPAWLFAALLVATLLALAGLVLRLWGPKPATQGERGRLHARRLMAAGIALMCLPIVYAPALAGLDLWYGRWLFAMLGPIMIGLVLGGAEFVAVAGRRPHRTAIVVGITAAVVAALWTTSTGADLKVAFRTYHYGDRALGLNTMNDTVIGLGIVAVLIEVGALVSWRPRVPALAAFCTAIVFANAILLIAFVRPLYAPLTADDYAGLVSRYLAAHETIRAADVYVSAVKSYPQAAALRSLADRSPSLLLGGSSSSARTLFWQWVARGNPLRDRDALLMLANDLRLNPESQPPPADALERVLAEAEEQPDLAEAAVLVRMAVAPESRTVETAWRAIDAGHGQRLDKSFRNREVVIDGFTAHPISSGGTQLMIYFRAFGNDLSSRRLWMHAYQPGVTTSWLEPDPVLAPAQWTRGEPMWELFELPPGLYVAYAGAWVGNDIGGSVQLGVVP